MTTMIMHEVRGKMRAGDIIMHQTPRAATVRECAAAYRDGKEIPPIWIGDKMREQWRLGSHGMEKAGYGYFVSDGHCRLAAFIEVFGPDAEIDVIIRSPQPWTAEQSPVTLH